MISTDSINDLEGTRLMDEKHKRDFKLKSAQSFDITDVTR